MIIDGRTSESVKAWLKEERARAALQVQEIVDLRGQITMLREKVDNLEKTLVGMQIKEMGGGPTA